MGTHPKPAPPYRAEPILRSASLWVGESQVNPHRIPRRGEMDMEVVFINDRNVRVTKRFDSEYRCRLFVNKLKRSRRCTLVSFPNFK